MNYDLKFDGELLIPSVNLVAYRQVYTIESWLRRICLSAWMGRFGSTWVNNVDPASLKTLESRTGRNRRRLYLGAESQDDLIWQATHGELVQLLTAAPVVESVASLTGADSEFLVAKLAELREIRNVLAHNRALTRRTYIILAGLVASLEESIESFKSQVLYRKSDIMRYDDDSLGSYLEHLLEKNDWSRFQAFVAQCGEFVEFVSLPVDRQGRWPSAELLLKAFHKHLDGIVAFCLNKEADEYSVLVPGILDDEAQMSICKTFASNPNVWTDLCYEEQSPRFICSPKVWFYENRQPGDDVNLGFSDEPPF